jgi:hypothetical protein
MISASSGVEATYPRGVYNNPCAFINSIEIYSCTFKHRAGTHGDSWGDHPPDEDAMVRRRDTRRKRHCCVVP